VRLEKDVFFNGETNAAGFAVLQEAGTLTNNVYVYLLLIVLKK
jgi:hypothetical protein